MSEPERAEFRRWQNMTKHVFRGVRITPERVDRACAALRASGAPDSVRWWLRAATGMGQTPREDEFLAEMLAPHCAPPESTASEAKA